MYSELKIETLQAIAILRLVETAVLNENFLPQTRQNSKPIIIQPKNP